jgi:hypothetical protein
MARLEVSVEQPSATSAAAARAHRKLFILSERARRLGAEQETAKLSQYCDSNARSDDVGARIEANEDYIGQAPLTLTIFGDKDGTFHNFGSKDYIIRAFPVATNQFLQTKVFRTGGWFSEGDRVPSRIFFDMEQPSSGFSIDLKPRY